MKAKNTILDICVCFHCVHVHSLSTKLIVLYLARWGRCQEGYGEDPYLQAEFGTLYVKALQFGPDPKCLESIVSKPFFVPFLNYIQAMR